MSLDTLNAKIDRLIELATTNTDKNLIKLLEEKDTLNSFFRYYTGSRIPRFTISPKVKRMDLFCAECYNLLSWDNICDTSSVSNMSAMFQNCRSIVQIIGVDISNVENASYIFNVCMKLETIGTPLNFQKVTSTIQCFYLCYALKNVRIVQETIKVTISFANSSLLTPESIQSIIDGLADLTEKKPQKITFHSSIVSNRLTDEQLSQISKKNWVIG